MYVNNPGHMTKVAAMPIYGKNRSKHLLLWNRWTDFNKTWHVEVGSRVLQCDPAMSSIYFMARSA